MSAKVKAVLAAALVAACGSGDEASEGYDDRAERAALIEGRGYSYVGFVPVPVLGVDGVATVQPRAFTVHDGVPGAVIEVTRRLQQGPVTFAMSGFFTNGFVDGPDVSVVEPNLSSDASFDGLRTRYWFEGGRAMGQLNATIFAPHGRWSHVVTRAAGADQRQLEIEPQLAFPVDAQGLAYAYRSSATLGVSTPTARAETTAGTGRSIALGIAADGDLRVATTEARDAGVFLAVYRRADATLERVAELEVEAALDGAALRVLHANANANANVKETTYVAAQREDEVHLYRVEGGALVRVTLPAGDKHTFALDDAGALYVGFSDPANGGRATVQKLSGAEAVTVGQAGFSRDAVTAHVFPHGADVYVMFTSTKELAGAAIACAGPSCVPYRKKTPPPPSAATAPTTAAISCSYSGDLCREATGTTPDGVKEFEAWCLLQSTPTLASTFRAAACPREGVVGGCRKRYSTVEEISWSYGTYGKTADMVATGCAATGTELVPAP
ncbi:MAG: hypothetical protein KIT84_29870 [Labilithrix sp.]|nr:hypothetical protein [Labilithrix sp.]MCW5815272.1 hypothetical protein [Labilithrix sp.]